MKALELVGQQFGRLTVIAKAGRNKWNKLLWWCECDCGEYLIILGERLRVNNTKSCGCLKRELERKEKTKYSLKYYPLEYKSWSNMKNRCLNKKNSAYKYYGKKGITVCTRWLKFKNFILDIGLKPSPEYTIERIDNNLGYYKSNCCWATMKTQSINKRIFKNNKTGYKGIYWRQDIKKYRAVIGIDNKKISLGCFISLQKAVAVRNAAELKYWHKESR